jgi:sortase A
MTEIQGPVIVRHPAPPSSLVKPGLHSHNIRRRRNQAERKLGVLGGLRGLLLILGLCFLGYYGYTLSNQYIYQAYENWAFDQKISGRAGVTFADYLREETPFAFLVGSAPAKPAASTSAAPVESPATQLPRPAEGDLLGRIEIGRLHLSAMVREGVDAKTLSSAVGHVPATALPGQLGNFAIAAHRDTLFRALKDIQKDDLVSFQSANRTYSYKVVATKIVTPSDVSVLRSDGGGIIPSGDPPDVQADSSRLLTMITCYPFYYVGAAPKRFIVEAELVTDGSDSKLRAENPPPSDQTLSADVQPAAKTVRGRHSAHVQRAQPVQNRPTQPKKRSFIRKLLHLS